MKYTVVWKPTAEARLTDIWLEASSNERRAIVVAADRIDRLLRHDLEHSGHAVEGLTRLLIVDLLGIVFEILPQDRIVRVLTHRQMLD